MNEFETPAKKIRFLMHTHTLTMQDLAEELGLPKETLREILDEEAAPTPQLLLRICECFRLRADYFSLKSEKQPHPANPAPRGPAPTGSLASAANDALHKRRGRKVDLSEIALRQQALLDCLLDSKVIQRSSYETHLEILRARVIERQGVR